MQVCLSECVCVCVFVFAYLCGVVAVCLSSSRANPFYGICSGQHKNASECMQKFVADSANHMHARLRSKHDDDDGDDGGDAGAGDTGDDEDEC